MLPENNGIPDIVAVYPPDLNRVFADRAVRFRALAIDNALRDYLNAMSTLADAQQSALTVPLPHTSLASLKDCPLDSSWQSALQIIVSEMEKAQLPEAAGRALARIHRASPEELNAIANAILLDSDNKIEISVATFIRAALQVYWTALAGKLPELNGALPGAGCPVCSSPPVAGVVQGNHKVRYLVCNLCSTQWYMPRLICSNCASTEGISYLCIDNDKANATKAECCCKCDTYLKLFYREAMPELEAFADDVATLNLDLLVAEEGFSRTGPNTYLLPALEI